MVFGRLGEKMRSHDEDACWKKREKSEKATGKTIVKDLSFWILLKFDRLPKCSSVSLCEDLRTWPHLGE